MMRNGDINNHIAEHHLKTKHQIDWDSVTCITYPTDYYQRLILESCLQYWHKTLAAKCYEPKKWNCQVYQTNKQKMY